MVETSGIGRRRGWAEQREMPLEEVLVRDRMGVKGRIWV